MVAERREVALKALLIPTGIPLGAEEDCALVVVDPVNRVTLAGEVRAHLAAYQTRGARNDQIFHEVVFLESAKFVGTELVAGFGSAKLLD